MEKNCDYCDIKFPTNQGFAKYCGDECLTAARSCTICPHVGKDSYALKRHIRRRHTPIPCKGCSKDFTKHEANTVGEFCSPGCREENKTNWSKEYAQKPEVKHKTKLNARKYVARRKAENPEWGLAPLIEKPCRYCAKIIEVRGHSNRTLFCDDVCQAKHRRQYQDNKLREYREANRAKQIEIICIICGTSKLTHFHHTKFCGSKCRTSYKRLGQKGKVTKRARHIIWRALSKPLSTYPSGVKPIAMQQSMGFTLQELRNHMKSQFTDGMSWDNYGRGGWVMDHIRPVCTFDYTTTECEEFKKCWALNNLQPLWAADNMSKGNKWDGEVNA